MEKIRSRMAHGWSDVQHSARRTCASSRRPVRQTREGCATDAIRDQRDADTDSVPHTSPSLEASPLRCYLEHGLLPLLGFVKKVYASPPDNAQYPLVGSCITTETTCSIQHRSCSSSAGIPCVVLVASHPSNGPYVSSAGTTCSVARPVPSRVIVTGAIATLHGARSAWQHDYYGHCF
jgi:hypothetical protein